MGSRLHWVGTQTDEILVVTPLGQDSSIGHNSAGIGTLYKKKDRLEWALVKALLKGQISGGLDSTEHSAVSNRH